MLDSASDGFYWRPWEIKNTDGGPPESRGTVSYFQAGGIDRPLVIWKAGVGSIVTHQNWRGQFARGTWGEGTGRVGQSSDCAAWPSPVECVPVPWPGWNTNAWHDEAAKPQTVGTDTYWLGSLSVEMRDASGQMYMRNRYYNPGTGQFTQPDPPSSKANAFRHIYGSCALTVAYGISTAREITRSHEGFLRDGDDAQAADSRDDSGNNEIGMQEGASRENRHMTWKMLQTVKWRPDTITVPADKLEARID